MDLLAAAGVLGTVVSVISFAYAVYVTRKSRREKHLVFQVFPEARIAEALSPSSGSSLRLSYERAGYAPVPVETAYVHYVRFANLGRVPISQRDIAPSDPFRIEVSGGRALDVAIAGVTRDACRLRGGIAQVIPDGVSVPISFDFLDYQDGGLVQVVSDSASTGLALRGTIIGMPGGIQQARTPSSTQSVSGWGCVPFLVLQAAALWELARLVRGVAASWRDAWIMLATTVLLLLGPAITAWAAILATGPRERFKFSDLLSPPDWYFSRRQAGEGLRPTSSSGEGA